MDEWEEPHPGRRYFFSSTSPTISPSAADNVYAALKAPGKSTSHLGGAKSLLPTSRLLSRLWQRPTPATPSCSSCCCQLSTSILSTSQGLDAGAVPMMCHHTHTVDCLPMSTTQKGLAADTTIDNDDDSISLSFGMDTAASSECERVTISDIGKDVYGWEAELSRRESCSIVPRKRKTVRWKLRPGPRNEPPRQP